MKPEPAPELLMPSDMDFENIEADQDRINKVE